MSRDLRTVRLAESATAEALRLHETVSSQEINPTTDGAARGKVREVTIITAGWGSSGYYPREMLARDGPTVFPAGTHMYLNHPSLQEEMDQPERRVEDLAAKIRSTPHMVGNDLVAEAEIFDHHLPVINAIAGDIGVSIRAIGEAEQGEAEGKTGPIINTLTEGISVDFVTHAGAGGKIGMMIESARESAVKKTEEARNAAHWLESKLHREFTYYADDLFGNGYLTREERIGLSSAIGSGLDAFSASVAENVPALLSRDPFEDPSEAGVDVEESRSGGTTTKESEMEKDQELSELKETVRQHGTQLTELTESRDKEKARADRAEDALLHERARNIVINALEAEVEEGADALPELPERARDRVIEASLRGETPVSENGTVNKDKLTERVHKAVRQEAEYLFGSTDSGRVSGMGVSESNGGSESGNGNSAELTEADKEKLKAGFVRAGLSEKAAGIAAEGR